ncbi:NAD(P)H-binding protein [Plantactinospora sp. WMMB334]|uniref:NAD(P)H-binding protein n=1 Tax=Plantactinospora sp. WMMB334 TaxID=3404119 RepID=UPI003B966D2E
MSGVLVTAATGKTGTALVEVLRSRGVPVRAGSRNAAAEDPDAVRFDWNDPASHAAALRGIDRVYLVPPPSTVSPLTVVEPFLAEARRAGVRRLILLGSGIDFPGAPGRRELAVRVRREPGWVVIRPSGFMQNFLRPHLLGQGIWSRGEIRTAAGDGRVGWIDVHDVAEVAAALLSTVDLSPFDDYHLTGPQALSYREAASIITDVSGRPVRVYHVDVAEVAAGYRAAGLPAPFATSLAAIESGTRAGADARLTTSVLDLTGRPPRTFDDFARRNRAAWLDRDDEGRHRRTG